jgi:hypothetical protein
MPTNKNPIHVRVLSNETPHKLELNNPHSPLANVSPAVIPPQSHFKYRSPRSQLEKGFGSTTRRSKFESEQRSKFKLGYSSFYQNQNYHIIHDKGMNNEHQMSIQPNDTNITPFKKANATAKTMEF